MKSLKLIWQKSAPLFIQNFLNIFTDSLENKAKRKKILNYYRNKAKNKLTWEESELIRFLKHHRYSPFPFQCALKYDNLIPEVLFDESVSFHYVLFEGKKLYFPRNFTRNQVMWTMRSISKEQDKKSAHLYLTDAFQVENGSIMVDGGVAEGSLSLSLIEKLKKLYLIECEPNWNEALKLTFAPWKEKVEIVTKYLSDITDEQHVSIDNLVEVKEEEKYFIKLDVEGYEKQTLKGMNRFFSQVKNLKMCVCTYHFENDAVEISKMLENREMSYEFSEGWLLFSMENKMPSFRKALIRAWKE